MSQISNISCVRKAKKNVLQSEWIKIQVKL